MFIVIDHANEKSPSGAACLTEMSLLRSFSLFTLPYYKHAAPLGLANAWHLIQGIGTARFGASVPQLC